MARLFALARFVVLEFGPLVAFWILSYALGVKAAIVGSIVVIAADATWRRLRRLDFTRLYVLTSGLTLVFGAVDLMSAQPFMLKYEAAVTNVATGIAFVVGALGAKPLIQEVAEQRQGKPFSGGADIRRFFQLLTLFWAAYFFVKAGFYCWTAWTFPMAQAMALRSLIGGVSLGAMIGLSVTQGRRLFFVCRWLGLLPARAGSEPQETDRRAALSES
ncbi:MAG: septation protein IspZ [Roseiarcus sp.]|jgi:intracellular septation protein A